MMNTNKQITSLTTKVQDLESLISRIDGRIWEYKIQMQEAKNALKLEKRRLLLATKRNNKESA